MERGLRLTASEIERIMSDNPDVNWKLDVSGGPPASASLTLTLERGKEELEAVVRYDRSWPTTAFLAIACIPVLLVLLSGPTVDVVIISVLLFPATAASFVYGLRAKKLLAERSALRELLAERVPKVCNNIDRAWVEPVQSDHYARIQLVEWLLAERELINLNRRISGGTQAQNQLSPEDPLWRTLQTEIEALRSRRERVHDARQEDADRINAAVQRNLVERQRQAVDERRQHDEKRRRLEAEMRQRKYEERLRSIGDKEQARLEAQQRAQNWLHVEE